MERLNESELAYHQQVIATLRAAQAAFESWAGYLSGRYDLQPGEGVDDNGIVRRADPPPPEKDG